MHSFDEVDIVLNPSEECWRKLIKQCNATESWSFQWTDYATWKEGFRKFWLFCAVETSSGDPIASVTLSLDQPLGKDDDLYSIGIYYCHPDWRGTGIGSRLFNMVIALAGDANITLHGVMSMAPRYASKYGFDKCPSHAHDVASIGTEDIVNPGTADGYYTKPLHEVDWDAVVAYDRTILARQREKFLKKWIDNEGTYTRVVFDSSSNIVGFCCIREDVAGNLSVRPLYADNKDAARTVLSDLLEDIDLPKFNKLCFIFPEANHEALSLVSLFSAGRFSCSRWAQSQFTKHVIETPNHRIFSLSATASGIV